MEEGRWYTGEGKEGFDVGLWKEIRKKDFQLSNYIGFSVGNGHRIRFWLDPWCAGGLCATFSPLCLLWQFLKRSGWRRCGTLRLRRELESSFF